MAKTIPADEKVFMVSKSTNTTYSGSAALKAMNDWYTMEDVTNTVRPYKVYTALLTQSGGSNAINQTSGTFTIGVTYTFDTYLGIDDFSNIGGPGVAPSGTWDGLSFVATGTTPLVYTNSSSIDHNTGAPVATVLENTIGNVWFAYSGVGQYICFSNSLFTVNKSMALIGTPPDSVQNNNFAGITFGGDTAFYIDVAEGTLIDDLLNKTPIEIRVYN